MDSTVSLSSPERQDQLLQYVEQHQRATSDELSWRFDVSVATVRRDLETLQAQGLIQRFHGGAKTARRAPPELPALRFSWAATLRCWMWQGIYMGIEGSRS